MRKSIIFFIILTVITSNCVSQQSEEKSNSNIALTIYDDFAVVKDTRTFGFKKGTHEIKLKDVPTAIQPESVIFRCLKKADALNILEQNFSYYNINRDSLMESRVNKKVTINIRGSGADIGKTVKGTLFSHRGNGLIIKLENGDLMALGRNVIESIVVEDKKDFVSAGARLKWQVKAEDDFKSPCEIIYTTNNIAWNANYTTVLASENDKLSLNAWVNFDNTTGKDYNNADIKLIAGDVRKVREAPAPRRGKLMAMSAAEDASFEEKSFMEYHLYKMTRKTTLKDKQQKQVQFFEPVPNVPYEKLFIYEHEKNPDKIQVKIEFENKKELGLGMPLPAGKIRVFKENPEDDSIELVGEDTIDHTPKNEKLSLYIGNAFDIVPEHKIIDSEKQRRMRKETHEVKLTNRKNEAVSVYVVENFPKWVNWKITGNTLDYEKVNAYKIRFKVSIEADSEKTLTYTVTENW